MAALNRRKGPNVSHYLAGLNTVGDNAPNDDFLAQDDLSLFASTEFFDFDMGDNHLNSLPAPTEFDSTRRARKQNSANWQETSSSELFQGDFQFPELSHNFSPLATGPDAFPSATGANTFPIQSHVTSPSPATSPTTPKSGEKRKLNALSDIAASGNMDEAARIAAEEDKRRRNTAASARFRIKKKQREQALEKSAKEMTEKAQRLETKVYQLEMENKWLKSLITEKNDIGNGGFEELYEKFTKGNQQAEVRSIDGGKDGVGTSVDEDDGEDEE